MAPTIKPGINFDASGVSESCYYITSLSIPYLDPDVQTYITNNNIYTDNNLPRYTLSKAMLNNKANHGQYYAQTYVADDRLIKTYATSLDRERPASVVDYYKVNSKGLYADATGIFVENKVSNTYSADVKSIQLYSHCPHDSKFLPLGAPANYNACELQIIRAPISQFYVEIAERGEENSNRYGLKYYPILKLGIDYYE